MTQDQEYELTIKALHQFGQKIRRSRKASRQFLIDAGIILPDNRMKKKKTKKKK
jgi:hypothetical protein